MKDLYKQLHIESQASDATIRDALRTASPELQVDAEAVLLSPRRRQIYDRNRNLLNTIGELRLHLGLTYTRFWARSELREFWQLPTPVQPKPGRRVDSMLIAGAFRAAGHHGRHHATSAKSWIVAISLVVVASLGIWWWLHFH